MKPSNSEIVESHLYNPFVLKSFRSGFRSGGGNLSIGLWSFLLLLCLAGSFVAGCIEFGFTQRGLAKGLDVSVFVTLGFLIIAFAMLGLNQLVTSFVMEKERGTWEFIRLSTISSSKIISGFIWAKHVPVFFLCLQVIPIFVINSIVNGKSLIIPLLALGNMVIYSLFFSVVFLSLAFHNRLGKGSKANAIGPLFMIGIGAFLSAIQASKEVVEFPSLLFGGTFFVDLFDRYAGASESHLSLFSFELTYQIGMLLLVLPLGLLCFYSLSRCLRYPERKPLNFWPSIGFLVMAQMLLANSAQQLDSQWGFVLLLLGSYYTTNLLCSIDVRRRPQLFLLASRKEMDPVSLLTNKEGPTFGLALISIVLTVIVLVLLGALPHPKFTYSEWNESYLQLLKHSWALIIPFLAISSLRQYEAVVQAVRGNLWKNKVVAGGLIWLPLFFALPIFKHTTSSVYFTNLSAVSPLFPMQSELMKSQGYTYPWYFLTEVVFLAILVFTGIQNWRSLKILCKLKPRGRA